MGPFGKGSQLLGWGSFLPEPAEWCCQAVRAQPGGELGSLCICTSDVSLCEKAGSPWLQEHGHPVLAKWLLTSLVNVRLGCVWSCLATQARSNDRLLEAERGSHGCFLSAAVSSLGFYPHLLLTGTELRPTIVCLLWCVFSPPEAPAGA